MDSDYQLLQPLAWERLFLSLQQKMQQELLVKQKLAYLKRLVETYYESGDAAFAALLDEPEPILPSSW